MSVRARLGDERGVTLVELLVVCATLGIVLTGLVNVFVSGTRASADADARFQAQQNARLALDRLQYEARCASGATATGTTVTLTLPAACSHAAGTVVWSTAGGSLTRTVGASTIRYVGSLTPASSFSVTSPAAHSAQLPQLVVSMTVNTTNRASDAFTLTDAITLRNASPA
jgi:Tfp pilus assembly protein PilW